MINSKIFAADRHGRQFADVIKDQKALTEIVFALVNERGARERMVMVTVHLGLPALAGIVRALERNSKINDFFSRTQRQGTLRFRQFVGVAVRMTMVGMGFKPRGSKGYLQSFSTWFTRAELFSPPPEHSDREIWQSEQGRQKGGLREGA